MAFNIERISSGVIGLDDKMEGGFVKGTSILITGKTGTGKTAFSSSFLYQGSKEGEPGLYVTTEERVEDIRNDIHAMFGWDIEAYEKKKLFKIISVKPVFPSETGKEDINRLIKAYILSISQEISKAATSIKAQRVVVDSVSLIEMFVKDEYLSRVAVMSLSEKLKDMNVTALFTGTIPEESQGLTGGGIVEFIVDTVIKLDFVPVAEEFKRTLTVRKMRRTNHSTLIHPFEIAKEGVRVIDITE